MTRAIGYWTFVGNLDISTPPDDQLVTKIEALALLHGLQLALHHNLKPMEINMDATQVIENLKPNATTY